MPPLNLQVTSETGTLQAVVLGSVATFARHEPINTTQRHFYTTAFPRRDIMIKQQAGLVDVLEDRGVQIHWVESFVDAPQQIFTRDIGTVIGDTLIIGAMKEPIRQREPQALSDLSEKQALPTIHVDAGVIEGGDIILDRDVLFVGRGERTNAAGTDWLQQHFGDRFQIVALDLIPPFLHLDVVFNLVGQNIAPIYPPAFTHAALGQLEQRFKTIPITKEEQFALASNVLSLSPQTVISEARHERVNNLLQVEGLEVIALDYSEIAKLGGSFRCSTCPLVRE